MSDPFIGEIKMVGFNFAPRSWANCDGQLLSISSNTALFSLLGTTYGGDGETSFGLPDLRGRVPIHVGNGAGLSSRSWGQKAGAETHTLTVNKMPSHNHTVTVDGTLPVSSSVGNKTSPVDNVQATANDGEGNYAEPATANGNQALQATGTTDNSDSNQSVNHMPPFLSIRFVIALQGLYPPRD
jgi:microcystin-dependent protein